MKKTLENTYWVLLAVFFVYFPFGLTNYITDEANTALNALVVYAMVVTIKLMHKSTLRYYDSFKLVLDPLNLYKNKDSFLAFVIICLGFSCSVFAINSTINALTSIG